MKFQSSLNKHQIHKFNHRDHHELNIIYKIWHKWRTVFTKDSFIVEFRVFLMSESTNHVLTNIANKIKSLTNFIIKYENVFLGMHSLDFKEDFKCKQGDPQRSIKRSNILCHAAWVYTCKIFKLFENEFLNSFAIMWK